jgi:hypothetical protein
VEPSPLPRWRQKTPELVKELRLTQSKDAVSHSTTRPRSGGEGNLERVKLSQQKLWGSSSPIRRELDESGESADVPMMAVTSESLRTQSVTEVRSG